MRRGKARGRKSRHRLKAFQGFRVKHGLQLPDISITQSYHFDLHDGVGRETFPDDLPPEEPFDRLQ